MHQQPAAGCPMCQCSHKKITYHHHHPPTYLKYLHCQLGRMDVSHAPLVKSSIKFSPWWSSLFGPTPPLSSLTCFTLLGKQWQERNEMQIIIKLVIKQFILLVDVFHYRQRKQFSSIFCHCWSGYGTVQKACFQFEGGYGSRHPIHPK